MWLKLCKRSLCSGKTYSFNYTPLIICYDAHIKSAVPLGLYGKIQACYTRGSKVDP